MTGRIRGVVVSFDDERGFGFIRANAFDEDVFVHVSAVTDGRRLRPGQRVRFEAEGSDRGPRAVRVEPGETGLPPVIASAMTAAALIGAATLGLRGLGASWLISWLLVINLATFAIWAWDKHRAVRDRRRVPESVLLGLSAIGGSIGGGLGVMILRHKRRKPRFLLALGTITTLQLIALAFRMGLG